MLFHTKSKHLPIWKAFGIVQTMWADLENDGIRFMKPRPPPLAIRIFASRNFFLVSTPRRVGGLHGCNQGN
jgi:hypothetical protein